MRRNYSFCENVLTSTLSTPIREARSMRRSFSFSAPSSSSTSLNELVLTLQRPRLTPPPAPKLRPVHDFPNMVALTLAPALYPAAPRAPDLRPTSALIFESLSLPEPVLSVTAPPHPRIEALRRDVKLYPSAALTRHSSLARERRRHTVAGTLRATRATTAFKPVLR